MAQVVANVASATLHFEASCDRRELPTYDQYPAFRATAASNKLSPNFAYTPNTPRIVDDSSMLPAASAAAALAQLHNHKLDSDWESELDWMSDTEAHKQAMRASIELPPIHSNHIEPTSDPFSHHSAHRRRDLLPSILSASPPGRSSTLPPIQRHPSTGRPRKQSVSKRAREPQHRRQKSRGDQAHLRRMSHDRKAQSAEPSTAFSAAYGAYGKRWEDLIDAATSATEDVDDDRTPVPPSPVSVNRASMPPFSASHFQGYQASPLQQALTPPSYMPEAPEPFPSVESGESGDNFHIESQGLSDSSPSFSSTNIQIYCAACQKVSLLKESYACTECICGICQACVEVLMGEQGARRKCPRCATIGGRFKPFQLDIR
ncbi:transcription factor protein [Rutstroemia sp. NJR-2017a BBW]|nr:transcription factor protein [Rutstroemia sp. NJR-2017a BBW]